MNIILIGFKNCGKSTIGKRLAAFLQYSFIDTDRMVEQFYTNETSKTLSVREIYVKEGEKSFRKLEKNVVATLADLQNTIIATGGGTVLDSDNVEVLKKFGKLIYLFASKELLLARAQTSQIPAFLDQNNARESFEQMYIARQDIYKSVADFIIAVDECNVDDIVDKILIKCRAD